MKDVIKRLLDAGKLEAETATTLTKEATEIESKLADTRNESIERRQKIKELTKANEAVENKYEAVLEQLGIDASGDVDLDVLADKAKGKTEADKQMELKIKRLERDLETAGSERDEIRKKLQGSQKDSALRKAMAKHEWLDTELVEQVLENQIEVSEDGVFMVDGSSVDDGIAAFAKSKPHLLKSHGEGGSGYQLPNGGSQQPNPFAKKTQNLTEQAKLMKENPSLAATLKAQAG